MTTVRACSWLQPHSVCAQLLTAVIFVLPACTSPEDAVEGSPLFIIGGNAAATCSWPSSVALLVSRSSCSGTLIHPKVVLTAGHCIVRSTTLPTIVFGEQVDGAKSAKKVQATKCQVYPGYDVNIQTDGPLPPDIGFCLLAEDVTDVPIVPIMPFCEASVLKKGDTLIEVGYGPGGDKTFDIKHWLPMRIQAIRGGTLSLTAGNQNGDVPGDSGGPAFFQMPDKTWRVVGVCSTGDTYYPAATVARSSRYTLVPSFSEWLEKATEVDLTPCHDGDKWASSGSCKGFPTTPDTASGGWDAMCSEQQGQVTPQSTCAGASAAGNTSAGGGSSCRIASAGNKAVWQTLLPGLALLALKVSRRRKTRL